IKLLEEILSFRMQGVEIDIGDMYVEGHKAASDVSDEIECSSEVLRLGKHIGTGRFGMPDNVSQGFLDNAVDRRFYIFRKPMSLINSKDLESGNQPGAFTRILNKAGESLNQSQVVETCRS